MSDASFTAEAIDKAPDHAVGHRWTATGSVPIPFDPSFPYLAGPAGDINASVEDCARWLRLQIGNGVFAGRRLISADNLAATRTPKVAISETVTYAMGWVSGTATYAMGWIINATPSGRIIWHDGGTSGFGALIGFLPDKGIGIVEGGSPLSHSCAGGETRPVSPRRQAARLPRSALIIPNTVWLGRAVRPAHQAMRHKPALGIMGVMPISA